MKVVKIQILKEGTIFHFNLETPYPIYLVHSNPYAGALLYNQVVEYEWYLSRIRLAKTYSDYSSDFPKILLDSHPYRGRISLKTITNPEKDYISIGLSKYYTDLQLGTFTFYDTLES